MVFLIIGIIFFAISVFLFIKSQKIQFQKQYDKQLDIEQTLNYEQRIRELNNQYKSTKEIVNNLNLSKKELEEEIQEKKTEAIAEYTNEKNRLSEQLETFKENTFMASENYFNTLEEIYEQKEQEYKENVLKLNTDFDITKSALDKIKATLHAATEAQLRQKEIEDNKFFYTIQLSPQDLGEINIIKSIENKLSDKRPLRMLIWTTYFSKKANDLCSRVLGNKKITGIYKITNLEEDRCYIGQAKDIKERWREHMKCGLGIDTPAGNKLYAAMAADGLECFTFELIEECSSSDLNEKERFYIDLYDSYHYGYNSNTGVKK